MNPTATALLDMSARNVIGTIVKYRSPKSTRVRTGRITCISAAGVRVVSPHDTTFFLGWSDLLEIVEQIKPFPTVATLPWPEVGTLIEQATK